MNFEFFDEKYLDKTIVIFYICNALSESSSVGRAQPCQGWGREFESRLSLHDPLAVEGFSL